MSELSRMLVVSNGNVTGIVDRLSEDGFMLREPVAGDRRAFRVRLTQKGTEEFLRQAEEHEKWVGELLGGLDPDDCAHMGGLLSAAVTIETEETSND